MGNIHAHLPLLLIDTTAHKPLAGWYSAECSLAGSFISYQQIFATILSHMHYRINQVPTSYTNDGAGVGSGKPV